MKNIYLILLTALILTSCEGKKVTSIDGILATNDLTQIKSKKLELDAKKQELSVNLKKINDHLDALKEDKNIPLITFWYHRFLFRIQSSENWAISTTFDRISSSSSMITPLE